MPAPPRADQAATLRSEVLTFLRAPVSRQFFSMIMDEGHSFIMPASWSALPQPRQVEEIVAAEDARIAGGTTFAMSAELTRAAREAGEGKSLALPFTEDVLPAPSGMLGFSAEEPLMRLDSGPVIAVTWGPALEGFWPGVHLTWWTAMPDQAQEPNAAGRGRLVPMIPDFDVHLPFLPHFDTRLHKTEVPSGLIYSVVPLRTVVAAWYALTAQSTELAEQQPSEDVMRALTELKVPKSGVQVATTDRASTTLSGITDRAAQLFAELPEKPMVFEPTPEPVPTPKAAAHGVFESALDHQLDAAHRRTAHIYREAADHWHRLESQTLQKYPGLFESLEELRVREGDQWQPWCWMPSLRVTAWLMKMYNAPIETAMWDGPRIAALGAWRASGRHSVLTTLPLEQTASDRVPLDLLEDMPALGLGMVIDDNGTAHAMLACLDDVSDRGSADAELLLITDYGMPNRMLEDLTKITLFLTGNDLLDAVKVTQAYYDAAAVKNGDMPLPASETMYAEHAHLMGLFTGLLSAICSSGAELQDAGARTGRKLPATWPPEPSVLPEMTLWLLTGTPPDQ